MTAAVMEPADGPPPWETRAGEVSEVVGTAIGGRSAEDIAAEARRLLDNELRRHGDWLDAPEVEVSDACGRIRVSAETRRSDVVAGALYAAGARWVTVRIYPDAAHRDRWSDFGRPGFRLPLGVHTEFLGGIGARPKLIAPLVAGGVVALSLERLGIVSWVGALMVLAFIAIVVMATVAAVRRARIEWVRFGFEAPEEEG